MLSSNNWTSFWWQNYAKRLMHGKTSKIFHIKRGLFKNINNDFEATRYHSLVVDRKNFPKNLLITANKNKTIMSHA